MKKTGVLVGSVALITVGYLGAVVRPTVTPQVETIPQKQSNVAYAQTIERGFADLVKRVGPGVVNISTYARQKMRQPMYGGQGGQGGMQNDETFRRFYEEFFGGRMPQDPRRGQQRPDEDAPEGAPVPNAKVVPMSLGTGFVIDAAEGLILTNNHVIQDADEVKVQFNEDDGELIPAEVIGKDPELDVALLKIKQKMKLVAIPMGDSDKIDVGEYVIAIGNPFSYGHSVSHGILSAKGRKNPEFRLGRYLQTDASINPGNSGGPLVSMRGEVIGINNAIDARAHGIGFAIPINMVKSILPQLKTKGSVSRAFLGVSAADLTEEIAEQMKIDKKLRGVVIADVSRGQAADKAGLKPYDVITAINGERVTNAQDMTAKITSVPIGQAVEIKYMRAGKEFKTSAKVGERPTAGAPVTRGGQPNTRPDPRILSSEEFGFRAEELNTPAGTKAVVISEVAYSSPAANAGLVRGDVILDVGGKEVKALVELEKALNSIKGKSVMLRIKRFDTQGNSFVSVAVLTK